ncbi:MAG: hypothetical protein HRT35_34060 [Algicola sp.]|nr:hypothetical protein [Algicola sp.]
MIKSKYVKACMTIMMFLSFSSQASEPVYLEASLVKAIQITTGTDDSTYYLFTEGTWKPAASYADNAKDCPTPTYAMIKSSVVGADALLTVALTAKTTKQPVTLIGVCGYHEAYFDIVKIIY